MFDAVTALDGRLIDLGLPKFIRFVLGLLWFWFVSVIKIAMCFKFSVMLQTYKKHQTI